MLFYGILVGYRMLRGHDGLGLGDVKLAAVAGVWLDWLGIAAAVEMAALSALAAYLAVSLFAGRKMRRTAALPLGLFLAPSIWLAWLGETVLLR
jgi:leader peptidase (prepilin peptidase)/N-methyltransferase